MEEGRGVLECAPVVWGGQGQQFHQLFVSLSIPASQMLMFTAYLAVVVALYLVPLTISSPCIMEKKALGPKPAILGHRGAPMVSSDQSPVLWLLCLCEGCCWIWQSPGCSPGNGYNTYNFEALLPGITVKVKQGLNPESSDTPDALDTNKRASPALLRLVCAIVLFWLLLFIEL